MTTPIQGPLRWAPTIADDIKARLMATGAFADVWIGGLPEEYGQSASDLTAAALDPATASFVAGWDAQPTGGLCFAMTANITLLARHQDEEMRDEGAEILLNTLLDAVNGRSLAGYTLPGRTMISNWKWQKPNPPERRITALLTYQYIVEGWNRFDTRD